MKLAVTDTSVLIDLFDTDLLNAFFKLPYEVHLTNQILFELFEEQRDILDQFVKSGKLEVYTFTDADRADEASFSFSKGLSDPDKSVLIYTHSIGAIVLSGDKLIRNKAKSLGLQYHGILWIFDQLVDGGLLEPPVAIEKLRKLIKHNLLYRDSKVMGKGLTDRIRIWGNS
jgi:predicted nucleic acid-binding protein